MHKTTVESIKHPTALLTMLGISIVLFLVETGLVVVDELSVPGAIPVSGIAPTHPFVTPGLLLFFLVVTYALLLKTVTFEFKNAYLSILRENTRIKQITKQAVFKETGDNTHRPNGQIEGWLSPVVKTGIWFKLGGQQTPKINVRIPFLLALLARAESFFGACIKAFFSSTAPTALLLFGLSTILVTRCELILKCS